VVAVGGNALTAEDERGTADQILANAARMADSLAELHNRGWRIAVVHGNGPQVGSLAIQQEEGAGIVPPQPLYQLCAMTQGQLGSVLACEIDRRCGDGIAVAVVTHVEIDPGDPAFRHPTKPIGPFFAKDRVAELERAHGWQLVEDAGRGYRRVVPSPEPVGIVELSAVNALLDAGHIVLAAGGGGVAVTRSGDGGLTGVDAVIDKDRAAAIIATATNAADLYLLTGVDAVLLDFGTERQRPAHHLTADEASAYLAQGQFPPGSMGPKIESGLRFLADGGEKVIITSAGLLAAAASGEPGIGTRIEPLRAAAGGRSR
jgi:carbamate kinase